MNTNECQDCGHPIRDDMTCSEGCAGEADIPLRRYYGAGSHAAEMMRNMKVNMEAKDVGKDVMGNRSEFWRELSWRCGDEHANRICKWINFYCWLFNLGKMKFHHKLPRG